MGSCHHAVLTAETTDLSKIQNATLFFFFLEDTMRVSNTGKAITKILLKIKIKKQK